jgi:hypothetical protein
MTRLVDVLLDLAILAVGGFLFVMACVGAYVTFGLDRL